MPAMRVDTFDEFLQALFEPRERGVGDWYEDEDFEVDDETLTDWYIRLFTTPEFLFECFSVEKLERGFAAMINCNFQLAAIRELTARGQSARGPTPA